MFVKFTCVPGVVTNKSTKRSTYRLPSDDVDRQCVKFHQEMDAKWVLPTLPPPPAIPPSWPAGTDPLRAHPCLG